MNTRPTFPTYIDSSMRKNFSACHTKFYYSNILHKARSQEHVHLVAGGAYARGCEVVRKAYYVEGLDNKEALGAGCIALILAYGDFEPPEDSAKTCINMLGALAEYFLHYGMATDLVQPHWSGGKPCIEFSFALPIPDSYHPESGEPMIYTGRLDLLGIYNNSLWMVDEKTTTQLGRSWINRWKLASQPTGYCWAGREYGYPVVGALIRGISILKTGYGHAESIQYRPDYMIDRWLRQLRKDIEVMKQEWAAGMWDMNLDDSCSAYGGCQFLSVCTSKNRDEWLEADFVTRIWDPLKGHSDD